MGEYARLNRMLEEKTNRLNKLKALGADAEEIADCENGIGEIRGALLEMAALDGLDDYGEAFDY